MILVIDTALGACQAGLYRDGAALLTQSEPMARGHQEALGPMVAALLRKAEATPRDLTNIGVTLGPGSFTGLRVGLSFAKGMAAALDLNLQGVGTLEALLRHPALAGDAMAVIDGGRGRFYVQHRAGAHSLDAEGLVALARTASVTTLTGPAADRAADLLPGLHVVAQDWPSLDAIAELTALGGRDDLTPLYMREADAVASRRGIISLPPITDAAG
ncbi:MAG: tRNA (adenosine(37)-N6)-threonylcarbamoyltransferase complex dimerization subunit type 1 TsaB [Asticcacaulis sp.]|uniref:tRNA (adenosine(37)-N6)-threonylcarbamoyltransferase complex dimerization subunit type 1 TsaB n=1 Tax=Asticcacaulis sp. TaxID=1872648 RepID=UPI003F7BCF16